MIITFYLVPIKSAAIEKPNTPISTSALTENDQNKIFYN